MATRMVDSDRGVTGRTKGCSRFSLFNSCKTSPILRTLAIDRRNDHASELKLLFYPSTNKADGHCSMEPPDHRPSTIDHILIRVLSFVFAMLCSAIPAAICPREALWVFVLQRFDDAMYLLVIICPEVAISINFARS